MSGFVWYLCCLHLFNNTPDLYVFRIFFIKMTVSKSILRIEGRNRSSNYQLDTFQFKAETQSQRKNLEGIGPYEKFQRV